MAANHEIERLYQLPLGEFTGARNALAKGAGKDAPAVRALEKPTVPAWAINQLYWRERRAYDRLVRASERVRAGHAQALKGKRIDLGALERNHGVAVKIAAGRVRALLARAGDPATPATMKAVIDTLQALPGGGEPGRLTKALAPIGFGALGALLKSPAKASVLADVVTFAPPKPTPDETADAARRARSRARVRLRQVEAQATRTARALAAARSRLARADRRRATLATTLEKASVEAGRLRSTVSGLERDLRAAEQERARIRDELRKP